MNKLHGKQYSCVIFLMKMVFKTGIWLEIKCNNNKDVKNIIILLKHTNKNRRTPPGFEMLTSEFWITS